MTRQRNNRQGGFTFADLVMGLACIMIVTALLVPALASAKRYAARPQCAANLKAWCRAVNLYAHENNGFVLKTAGGGNPVTIGGDNDHAYRAAMVIGADQSGEINIQRMARYLPGAIDPKFPNFEPDITGSVGEPWDFKLSGLWLCPGATDVEVPQSLPFYAKKFWPIASINQYAYYGRVSEWKSGVAHPDDLTDKVLDPAKVLVSDSTYFTGDVKAGWHYNHATGGTGKPEFDNSSDGLDVPGAPDPKAMSGMNVGWGDGQVEWQAFQKADQTVSNPKSFGDGVAWVTLEKFKCFYRLEK